MASNAAVGGYATSRHFQSTAFGHFCFCLTRRAGRHEGTERKWQCREFEGFQPQRTQSSQRSLCVLYVLCRYSVSRPVGHGETAIASQRHFGGNASRIGRRFAAMRRSVAAAECRFAGGEGRQMPVPHGRKAAWRCGPAFAKRLRREAIAVLYGACQATPTADRLPAILGTLGDCQVGVSIVFI